MNEISIEIFCAFEANELGYIFQHMMFLLPTRMFPSQLQVTLKILFMLRFCSERQDLLQIVLFTFSIYVIQIPNQQQVSWHAIKVSPHVQLLGEA